MISNSESQSMLEAPQKKKNNSKAKRDYISFHYYFPLYYIFTSLQGGIINFKISYPHQNINSITQVLRNEISIDINTI